MPEAWSSHYTRTLLAPVECARAGCAWVCVRLQLPSSRATVRRRVAQLCAQCMWRVTCLALACKPVWRQYDAVLDGAEEGERCTQDGSNVRLTCFSAALLLVYRRYISIKDPYLKKSKCPFPCKKRDPLVTWVPQGALPHQPGWLSALWQHCPTHARLACGWVLFLLRVLCCMLARLSLTLARTSLGSHRGPSKDEGQATDAH